jgi:hypothetical protein
MQKPKASAREASVAVFLAVFSLMDAVPDATTLIKLNQRFGKQRMAKLKQPFLKSSAKTRGFDQASRLRTIRRLGGSHYLFQRCGFCIAQKHR